MADARLLPAAEADYHSAYGWYFREDPEVAERFEHVIDAGLRTIGETPFLFGLCDDRHRVYILRRFPYSLVYRVENEEVLVVAVPHARRKPNYWTRRG